MSVLTTLTETFEHVEFSEIAQTVGFTYSLLEFTAPTTELQQTRCRWQGFIDAGWLNIFLIEIDWIVRSETIRWWLHWSLWVFYFRTTNSKSLQRKILQRKLFTFSEKIFLKFTFLNVYIVQKSTQKFTSKKLFTQFQFSERFLWSLKRKHKWFSFSCAKQQP